MADLARGGRKAPFYTRSKKWIAENVREPLDYIQIDYERLRLDAMEWGVNTAELQNLRRLTPNLFRPAPNSPWHVKYDADLPANEATFDNARYCLDRAIAIVLKKTNHERTIRRPAKNKRFDPPTIYLGDPLYQVPSAKSAVVHVLNADYEYQIDEVLSGFDGNECFFQLHGTPKDLDESGNLTGWVTGYLAQRTDTESAQPKQDADSAPASNGTPNGGAL